MKKGRKVGVYNTWGDCQKQTGGFSGAIFKSFKTEKEAFEFLKNNQAPVKKITSTVKRVAGGRINSPKTEEEKDVVVAYTDGSCFGNGKNGAIGGYSVIFPKKDFENIIVLFPFLFFLSFRSHFLPTSKEPLEEKATNNIAEMTAIIRCLETVPKEKKLKIFTVWFMEILGTNLAYPKAPPFHFDRTVSIVSTG